ncbi:MAG: VWA domain-containing protein [Flavobacteriales bacterium]|nr:VWA domain-containing protein [Flavobacteriales bacterium]
MTIKDQFFQSYTALRSFAFLFLISFILLAGKTTRAQHNPSEEVTTRILFVFDASRSMLASWKDGGKKITTAKKLLKETMDSLSTIDNLHVALRVYGHQSLVPPQDCDDTRLEVPFGPNQFAKIKKKIDAIQPKGTTPIARSLEKAGADFTPCTNCRNIIILITDGLEACDEDPCAVSLMLQKRGIVLKPFVIGIGLDLSFKETFKCVGNYFDASNEETFRYALNIVVNQALNRTTTQVNLLDVHGEPSETNVNMTFYDNETGIIKYNYMHTLDGKGIPDTIYLDPLSKYRMVVHTIPGLEKKNIDIRSGRHNIIGVDAAQGDIQIKQGGLSTAKSKKYTCIMRENGLMETINIQEVGETVRYLVGKYDIEILSLPRVIIKDVKVSQSHTTTVFIPSPGLAIISGTTIGYGSVYVEKENELIWVCNLKDELTRETLSLQPGRYRVIFRSKAAKKSIYTIEKSFKIQSGKSVSIKLNL